MARPAFSQVWGFYPYQLAKLVLPKIGPRWADNPRWKNTCALRVSMALFHAGARLPRTLNGHRLPLGQLPPYRGVPLEPNVETLAAHLRRRWGAPLVLRGPLSSRHAIPAALRGRQGIIAFFDFHGSRGNLSDHIDVFNGSTTRRGGTIGLYFDATRIEFWELP